MHGILDLLFLIIELSENQILIQLPQTFDSVSIAMQQLQKEPPLPLVLQNLNLLRLFQNLNLLNELWPNPQNFPLYLHGDENPSTSHTILLSDSYLVSQFGLYDLFPPLLASKVKNREESH